MGQVHLPEREIKPTDYPKLLNRMSRIFKFFAVLFGLRAVAALVAIFQTREFAFNPLDSLVVACVCYTIGLVLDFLIELSHRVSYMYMMQERQNQVLRELHRIAKETPTEIAS